MIEYNCVDIPCIAFFVKPSSMFLLDKPLQQYEIHMSHFFRIRSQCHLQVRELCLGFLELWREDVCRQRDDDDDDDDEDDEVCLSSFLVHQHHMIYSFGVWIFGACFQREDPLILNLGF